MKTFTKILSALFFCLIIASNIEAAVVKIREANGRRIVLTINGKKFPQIGRVITINNMPKGMAFLKVYSYKQNGNGMANANLLYAGKLMVRSNYIYRCTVDGYNGLDVQEFCYTMQNGSYNYNNGTSTQWGDYDANDDDWNDNVWDGHPHNHPFNNGNGNWGNNSGNGGFGNNGNGFGNLQPMSANAFNAFKNSLRNSNFDTGRLTILKAQLTNTRITASQLRELVELFSFESSKLDAAKFGAKSVIDGNNLFVVYDAFDFENSKTAFANYITQNNLNATNGNGNGGFGGNGNGGFGGSGGYNGGYNNNHDHDDDHDDHDHGNNGYSNNGWGNSGYDWNQNNGTQNNGYNNSMGAQPFNKLKQVLSNSTSEPNRLKLMQTQIANARISAGQLNELVGLFNFENYKLDAAKFGASRVVDKQNLFTLYDAFSFESSKTEFAKYIAKLQ
jgi:hypothetical protein